MGMRNFANCGYLIPAIKLVNLFPSNHQEEYKQMLAAGKDPGEIAEFYNQHVHKSIPIPVMFFVATEETESQTLEDRELYAFFEEDDLFERRETAAYKAMKYFGVTPEFHQWVTFG